MGIKESELTTEEKQALFAQEKTLESKTIKGKDSVVFADELWKTTKYVNEPCFKDLNFNDKKEYKDKEEKNLIKYNNFYPVQNEEVKNKIKETNTNTKNEKEKPTWKFFAGLSAITI